MFLKEKNPSKRITDAYLDDKENAYDNRATHKKESLAKLSEFIAGKVAEAKTKIEEMHQQGFSVDTGPDRFGKILIDVKQPTGKRWYPKISGDAGGSMCALANGYDGYLVWSPKENSFAFFSKKKMDEDSLPGGFGQGRNTRGFMWTKTKNDPEPLQFELKDVLSKLAGRDFEIEGQLKDSLEKEYAAMEVWEKKMSKKKAPKKGPQAPANSPQTSIQASV